MLMRLFVYLVLLLTIGCGQAFQAALILAVHPNPEEVYSTLETDVQKLVAQDLQIEEELQKQHAKNVRKIASLSNPIKLGKSILRLSSSDIESMYDWVDDFVDMIRRTDDIFVSDKVRELRRLRDAETDSVRRARYERLIERLQNSSSNRRLNVTRLRRSSAKAVRSVERLVDKMLNLGWYFQVIFAFTNIYDKAFAIEGVVVYLDESLDVIVESRSPSN